MFGTEVSTDWQVGSPITYRGIWQWKAQDNNATQEGAQHSEQNWNMALEGMKKLIES